MKKNAMLKIAAVLLVAVLLTTCAISSTFAKYVSEAKTGTASARVAKWGIVVDTKTESDFGKTYTKDSTVYVDSSDKVVAPGTKGTISFKTDVTGTDTTEVRAIIDYTWNVQVGNFAADNQPINFYIGDSTTPVKLTGLQTALENALKDTTIEPKSDAKSQTVTIRWEWPFEAEGDQDAKDAQNSKDTLLGKGDYAFSISLTTQVVQDGANYAVQ